MSTNTSRSSEHSAVQSSKEGKEERRRRRRGPPGAKIVTPDLPTFLQQHPRNVERQTSKRSMDSSITSSIPTLDSEELNQQMELMEQMEILSMEEALVEKKIEEAKRKLHSHSAANLFHNNDTSNLLTDHNSDVVEEDSVNESDDDYALPKAAFFIPGITGRAKCLTKIGEKEKENSSSEDDKDNQTVETLLPMYFIPGINGQARCLKQSRKGSISQNTTKSETSDKSDSSSSKGKALDREAHNSISRNIDSIRASLASRR